MKDLPLNDVARIVVAEVEIKGFGMSSVRAIHLFHLRKEVAERDSHLSLYKHVRIYEICRESSLVCFDLIDGPTDGHIRRTHKSMLEKS